METFQSRFTKFKNNRAELLLLLSEIDEEKRQIKTRLSEVSSRTDKNLVGEKREEVIQQYKKIQNGLIKCREEVRLHLRKIKTAEKTVNWISNSLTTEYTHAFMAAADEILTEDQLNEIEDRANEIVATTK